MYMGSFFFLVHFFHNEIHFQLRKDPGRAPISELPMCKQPKTFLNVMCHQEKSNGTLSSAPGLLARSFVWFWHMTRLIHKSKSVDVDRNRAQCNHFLRELIIKLNLLPNAPRIAICQTQEYKEKYIYKMQKIKIKLGLFTPWTNR